jgi:hypothetical protein
MSRPVYLGDGVYVHTNNGNVVLTTGHHEILKSENVIYLDHNTLSKFLEYLKELDELTETNN